MGPEIKVPNTTPNTSKIEIAALPKKLQDKRNIFDKNNDGYVQGKTEMDLLEPFAKQMGLDLSKYYTDETWKEKDIKGNTIITTLQNASVSDFIKNREKNTKRILLLAQLKGYKSNLSIKNQQIKNQYYTGGSYNIQYSGLKVTVTNNQTGKKHILDLYSLLDNMSDKEIVAFLLFIQKQPAEVLDDLAVEMDDILSPTGRDMHTIDNREFVAGGYYRASDDSIVTSPVHLIHELGHAVDYSGKVNRASTTNNEKYIASFYRELEKYKKMGGIQYDYNNKQTWKRGEDYNYCTANERELFAESYQLAMTGDCRSKNVIMKYFPETFKIALEIIKKTRQKSDLDRRYTPQRKMITDIVSAFKK